MISTPMHGRLPTVADLRKSGRISSHEIVAAICHHRPFNRAVIC
ncbi:hypothetical protein [Methylobacterium pseudosasicola]|nr:hypothetical protein [Methylobacterium pseudosasicola]